MSDATIVAGEIQDLALAVGEVAGAIKLRQPSVIEIGPPVFEVNIPPQQAPNVNIPPWPEPVVTVQAPNVRVAPNIVVERCKPTAYTVDIIERDASGFISRFKIIPDE